MMQEMELKQDLFIVPSEKGEYIIYSPLRGCAFYANSRAAEIVKKYMAGDILSVDEKKTTVWEYIEKLEKKEAKVPVDADVNTDSDVVIILSQQCNLACTYCYAKESRSSAILSKEKLMTVINYILSGCNKSTKNFSFIGGGEPTLTWDLLEWAINYINNFKRQDQKTSISIATNGTLLTDAKIDFLRKNNAHIQFSFDILPDIQNTQRCFSNNKMNSFDIVNETIKKLKNREVSHSFRSTITKKNVGFMNDMVLFVTENYKNIKRIQMEQVTDANDNDFEFYDLFISNFFKARKTGKQEGIDVYNSISNSANRLKKRFCNGEFCITPTGNIVLCHRVSSENEKNFDLYHYGNITGKIFIDNNKLKKIMARGTVKRDDCEICFAKWHCAGGCNAEQYLLSEQQQLFKCKFTKRIITNILEEKLCEEFPRGNPSQRHKGAGVCGKMACPSSSLRFCALSASA
jgi:uncharacterized protein